MYWISVEIGDKSASEIATQLNVSFSETVLERNMDWLTKPSFVKGVGFLFQIGRSSGVLY